MASAFPNEPQPLNHPRPEAPSAPARKKQRSRNVRPKITVDQVTAPHVTERALQIGRRTKQRGCPEPGHEGEALNALLRRMQNWAADVAPEYSLAEFVVAAQDLSGNRTLKPILGNIRLAEIREVDALQLPEEPVPVEKAGEEIRVQGGWEEPDVFMEHMEQEEDAKKRNEEALDAEIQAKIEKNRLLALERRKKTMERIAAERGAARPKPQPRQKAAGSEKAASQEGAPKKATTAPQRIRDSTDNALIENEDVVGALTSASKEIAATDGAAEKMSKACEQPTSPTQGEEFGTENEKVPTQTSKPADEAVSGAEQQNSGREIPEDAPPQALSDASHLLHRMINQDVSTPSDSGEQKEKSAVEQSSGNENKKDTGRDELKTAPHDVCSMDMETSASVQPDSKGEDGDVDMAILAEFDVGEDM